MGSLIEVFTPLHKRTGRDYLARMTNDKVNAMVVASKYNQDYWDGDRKFGYGGYKYDGRWQPIAQRLIDQYNLSPTAKILDVGCGKAFLLHELKRLLPLATIVGFDISSYAITNAKEEIRASLFVHDAAQKYPFEDKEFDLVLSLTTLHNLKINHLNTALTEIERVGKNKFIVVESFRNHQELFNLQCWALTCQSFFSTEEWLWLFTQFEYSGDYEFIYFE